MDDELAELQNPDNWIEEEESLREPVRDPRAIVSVEFSREEFSAVAGAARSEGMLTTQFVRMTALARANEATSQSSTEATSVGGSQAKRGYAGNQGKSSKSPLSVKSRIAHLLSGH
jgi:hypothetical protein